MFVITNLYSLILILTKLFINKFILINFTID